MSEEFFSAFKRLLGEHEVGAESLSKIVKLTVAKPQTVIKRALLIGINYFGQKGELRGCHNDIANIEAYLRTCGYTEFTILLDSRDDPKFQSATCPTRDNITAAMRKVVAKCNTGDTLFVHYSGHGSHLTDNNGDEKDFRDECICPVDLNWRKRDSGFIRDDELNAILVQSLSPGVHLRVCFDSCHSGSALDLPVLWNTNQQMTTENNSKPTTDIVFISGCMDPQTSADAYINGQNSGAMTWALLATLAEFRRSGRYQTKWTWEDLVRTMRTKLRVEQYDQIPQLSADCVSRMSESIDIL